MIHLRKRILALVLSFVILAGCLPMTAMAQSYDLPQPISCVWSNPLLDIPVQERELPSGLLARGLVYHTDIGSAAAEVRQELVNHSENIQFAYQLPVSQCTEAGLRALSDELFEALCVHTGIPNEGDYLKWTCAGWTIGIEPIRYNVATDCYESIISVAPRYRTTLEQEEIVTQKVEELLETLAPSGSDYEKLKCVYDWVCDHIVYDYDNLYDDSYQLKYTAYAALIDRTSVCLGYAILMYRLALEMGIDCRIISGVGNGGDHAWNIVKIGNVYYDIDATWDASWSAVGMGYLYFLKCDEHFINHLRDEFYGSESFNAAYPMADRDYDPANPPVVQTPEGWVQEAGKWAYYENGQKLKNQWLKSGGAWYYLDANGYMATGWVKVGSWYYMGSSGAMQSGWKQIDGRWYYLGSDGAMRTGWQKVSGKWYYLGGDGAMRTGWQNAGGKWYYLGGDGAMRTGWQNTGGKWYYLGSDGAMRTGWVQLGGSWYYLNSGGAMVTGTQVISGVTYKFSSSGVWIG